MKVKNKVNFYFGIICFSLSIFLGGKIGWVTENYAVTLAFFGMVVGGFVTADSLQEEKKK